MAGWITVVGLGLGAMTAYDFTASTSAAVEAVDAWPAGLAIEPDPSRATLIVVLHPMCPCSKASVAELARVMEHVGDRVRTYAVFAVPDGLASTADTDLRQTRLWRAASQIAGVTPVLDRDGSISRRLDAHTSGQTYLYDTAGRLRFAGGITVGRGIVGDNDGQFTIERFINAGSPALPAESPTTTPVFGCDLD